MKSVWRVAVFVLALAAPAHGGELKVSTWNLNWLTTRSRKEADLPTDVYTRVPADFERLAFYARKLSADIIGFQEVDGLATAAKMFDPAIYSIATINEAVVQQVGIAVRKPILLRKNPDLIELDVEPAEKFRLRFGLDVTLALPGGANMRVLVVHLKTGCQTDVLGHSQRPQCMILARQIPPLSAWVAARESEGVAFLVLGDFNRVFDEPEQMGDALAKAAHLARATEGFENPCWDGARFIDHIFAGGPARAWMVPGSLRVQIFHEAGEAWKARLSDHCPVSVKLNIPVKP